MKSQQIQQYQRLTKELDDLNKKYQELRKKNQEMQTKIKRKSTEQKQNVQKSVQKGQKQENSAQKSGQKQENSAQKSGQKGQKQENTQQFSKQQKDNLLSSVNIMFKAGIRAPTKFDDKHIIYSTDYKTLYLFNVETNNVKKLFSFDFRIEGRPPLYDRQLVLPIHQHLNQIIVTKNSKYIVLVASHQISIYETKSKKEVDVLRYRREQFNKNGEIRKVVYLEEPNLLAIVSNSDEGFSLYDLSYKRKLVVSGTSTIPYDIYASSIGIGDKKDIFYNPYKKEILIPYHLKLIRLSAETLKEKDLIDFKSIVTNAEKRLVEIEESNPIMGDIDGKYLYLYSNTIINPDDKYLGNRMFNGIIRINLMNYKTDRIYYPKNYGIQSCMTYKKNQMIVVKYNSTNDHAYISIDTIGDNKIIKQRVIHISDEFVGNKLLLFGNTLYYNQNFHKRHDRLVKIELEDTPDIAKQDQTKIKDFDKSKFTSRRKYDEVFQNHPNWKLKAGKYGYGDYIQASDRSPKNISLKNFRGDPFTASQTQLADYVQGKSIYRGINRSRKFR